jgi:hypothetical protein
MARHATIPGERHVANRLACNRKILTEAFESAMRVILRDLAIGAKKIHAGDGADYFPSLSRA